MAPAAQKRSPMFQRINPGPILDSQPFDEDIEMVEAEETTEKPSSRMIVAVDFGTTFSSVAYVILDGSEDFIDLVDIKCISRYPDDRPSDRNSSERGEREDVPTEIWYNIGHSSRSNQSEEMSMRLSGQDSEDKDTNSDISIESSEDENETDNDVDNTAQEYRVSQPLFWGFGVQRQLRRTDVPKGGIHRLARFKLMLDMKNPATNKVRDEIEPTLKKLKKLKVIEQSADVITDYLHQLLSHTKSELQRLGDYNEITPIEFVLCVPAVWPSKACRTMQTAISVAAHRCSFGNLKDSSLDNLFIISEPEAAAACVLMEEESSNEGIFGKEIVNNEIIVILDAGGGTIDAVTYQISNSHPLRLSEEVVDPNTMLCGASYINENYQKLLMKRLKRETYLETSGETIQRIVEAKVVEFENGEKRLFDPTDLELELELPFIRFLRPNPNKRLIANRIVLTRKNMKDVFKRSLKGAAELLKEQLDGAKENGYAVKKVILIGGFGKSPYLRAHLRELIAEERNFLDQEIQFLTPAAPSTVVARGAVLRAFNKENGPDRVIQCSYGFLRTEPYEPELWPAHKNTRCIIDKVDGEKYVDNTIDWLIKKGEKLERGYEISRDVKHTFPLTRNSFVCEEVLYVSDKVRESHYRKTHFHNQEAEVAGRIIVDMTFLRTEGHIEPEPQSETSEKRNGAHYWSVEFQLVMIVDGRNLRYEARWPKSDVARKKNLVPKVQAKGQVCIAAAFLPGTE